jgi:IK cytokine
MKVLDMFRAVAPNARENHDAAERRRQMIQESKYLGGDMEHTHLVKGLDFALLQKVRFRHRYPIPVPYIQIFELTGII